MSSILTKVSEKYIPLLQECMSKKPVPLGELAKNLGLIVKLTSLKPGRSGLIEKLEDGLYKIKINRYEVRTRQRFTLAHEIAHYLLHQEIIDKSGKIQDNILYRSGQPEQVEFEANRLASEIILPTEHVKLDYEKMLGKRFDEIVEQLSSEWQVSDITMEIKLELIRQGKL